MTDTERLEAANAVLVLYAPHVRLKRAAGRLWLCYEDGKWNCRKAAVLNRDGSSLACRYGALSMGGTCAQATAMLVRWMRGLRRVPLHAWEYWTSPTVLLGGGNGPAILAALRNSDYADPEQCACVHCGKVERCADWWSLDGVVGPCCWGGRCRGGQADG